MSGNPIYDGGAAFPFTEKYDSLGTIANPHERGMSLRDWFAATARREDVREYEGMHYQDSEGHFVTITKERARYVYADAMLAARVDKGGQP